MTRSPYIEYGSLEFMCLQLVQLHPESEVFFVFGIENHLTVILLLSHLAQCNLNVLASHGGLCVVEPFLAWLR